MCARLHTVSQTSAVHPPARRIRVVLAEAHAPLRQSMRNVLQADRNIEVVAEAGDLGTVNIEVDQRKPDVLVLALHDLNGSHLGMLEILAGARNTNIVLATMEPDPRIAASSLTRGARGYVLKDRTDEDLIPAVRAAARGEQYVSPTVADRLGAMR